MECRVILFFFFFLTISSYFSHRGENKVSIVRLYIE